MFVKQYLYQGFPNGVILVSWGAIIISKGAKGRDFKILGEFKTLKLTLDILELRMKSKKKSQAYLLVNFKLI